LQAGSWNFVFKEVKRAKKERQHVVFVESHKITSIRKKLMKEDRGSPPYLCPLARLSPEPDF
jgi:hypothetical protein